MTRAAPHRRAPRPVSLALEQLGARLAPATTLARAQSQWPAVVGPAIAEAAVPTAEHDGVLTVTCAAAVWAQELDLMGPRLVEGLNQALGAPLIRALRCRSA